jgi:4,5-DOPA dioxygenase extradiol
MTPPRSAQSNRTASIFLSHGVSLLAADDEWPTTIALRNALAPIGQAASTIVVVSAHWQTDTFSITADQQLPVVNEGLPTELLRDVGPFSGSPELAASIADRIEAHGLSARLVKGRGLDHGATIALRLLDPKPATPVVQISLQRNGDPGAHHALGQALQGVDSLVVASGGAVHNLATLQRFAPHGTIPPKWAEQFRAKFHKAVNDTDPAISLVALMADNDFALAHPTTEHYLPVLINAGLEWHPTLAYDAWQWSTLAMTTYVHTPKDWSQNGRPGT